MPWLQTFSLKNPFTQYPGGKIEKYVPQINTISWICRLSYEAPSCPLGSKATQLSTLCVKRLRVDIFNYHGYQKSRRPDLAHAARKLYSYILLYHKIHLVLEFIFHTSVLDPDRSDCRIIIIGRYVFCRVYNSIYHMRFAGPKFIINYRN